MTIIDTRGKLCPEPLIITKRAIAAYPGGAAFEVLSDNATARGNLMSYLAAMGIAAECREEKGIFYIRFSTGEGQAQTAQRTPVPAVACDCETNTGGYAVVIRSQTMGTGNDDLGALLMRSCVNSLGELDALPALVVLYNAGVMLALQGADTAAALTALAARGVRVMVCGTCVDYFGVKERLAVGEVSNMLSINNALAGATHIIYP